MRVRQHCSYREMLYPSPNMLHSPAPTCSSACTPCSATQRLVKRDIAALRADNIEVAAEELFFVFERSVIQSASMSIWFHPDTSSIIKSVERDAIA
jgi:hypothetical protein